MTLNHTSMTDNRVKMHSATLRLWQLISPQLPVGAYAYSQGLEYAAETGWVIDEDSARQWILGQLNNSLSKLDIPVLARLYHGWSQGDLDHIKHWNAFLLASRESSELLAEDQHLGSALYQLLADLGFDLSIKNGQHWPRDHPCSFATMFAMAANGWDIALVDAAQGYLWAWCENQVAAAIKIIPLGQTAGQRMLSTSIEHIPTAAAIGLALADDDIGALAPAVGIASALHETQYSRLFRS